MDLEHLLYETEGPIASITLNRPERMNAITGQTMSEIGEALARIQADDSVSVAEASPDKVVGAVRRSDLGGGRLRQQNGASTEPDGLSRDLGVALGIDMGIMPTGNIRLSSAQNATMARLWAWAPP